MSGVGRSYNSMWIGRGDMGFVEKNLVGQQTRPELDG